MQFKAWLLENDFDSWFKGSKMVDRKTKKPTVYYHGTRMAGFNQFDPNKAYDGTFHFSHDPHVGDGYAQAYDDDENPAVYPVHLNFRKPLNSGKPITPKVLEKMLKIAAGLGVVLSPETLEELKDIPYLNYGHVLNRIKLAAPRKDKDILKRIVSALGYDSFIPSGSAVQAFEPGQIKSVFAKNYDPNSKDIV
jgi:hypothetical protein